MSDPALVQFVRDVLGCACPDEVLRSIRVDRGALIPGCDVEVTRLDAGGRLLVWVVRATGPAPLRALIAAAVAAGFVEREQRRFNRFRLVIATDDPAGLEGTARAAFAECCVPDDRVHLHVVAVEDCPGSAVDS